MICVDYRDTRPIYEQVVEKFKVMILREVLHPDDKIPSVRNLAVDLSINPNTIQRAYAELERQGYIYTVKGKGNFVSDSGQLLLKYKEEIFEEIKNICRTAFEVGITQEEIVQSIKESAQAINGKSGAGMR
ncbi:MAG: GntR family transcriptional regulator [Lachnospiraceae bacterium]|nr:GntR family transcriptional regulator [Lachnospiraceae bacterium]